MNLISGPLFSRFFKTNTLFGYCCDRAPLCGNSATFFKVALLLFYLYILKGFRDADFDSICPRYPPSLIRSRRS